MPVTATNLDIDFATELTAKYNDVLNQTPIEQSLTGTRWLDMLERDFEVDMPSSKHYQFAVEFIVDEDEDGGWYDDGDVTRQASRDYTTITDEREGAIVKSGHLWKRQISRNMGPRKWFDLVSNTLNALKQVTRQGVAKRALTGTSDTKKLNGLHLIVPQTPNGTAIHGIDSANNAGWANQTLDFGGNALSSAAGQAKLDEAIAMSQRYGADDDGERVFVCTRAAKLAIKKGVRASTQVNVTPTIEAGRVADLGFRDVYWEGVLCLEDKHAAATVMHLVSKKHLKLASNPAENYTIEGPYWVGSGQHGFEWHCYWAGQMLCTKRAPQIHCYNFLES